MLACFAICTASAFAYAAMKTPSYAAQARLLFDRSSFTDQDRDNGQRANAAAATRAEVIHSRLVAQEVAENLLRPAEPTWRNYGLAKARTTWLSSGGSSNGCSMRPVSRHLFKAISPALMRPRQRPRSRPKSRMDSRAPTSQESRTSDPTCAISYRQIAGTGRRRRARNWSRVCRLGPVQAR